MTVQELEKELKLNILEGIYLMYGEETFLLESSLKKMKKLFGEMILGINYIQIDDTNVEELISDLETPAFGFEKKLVIVKNSGLLKKEGKRVNAKLKELKEKAYEYFSKNIDEIKKFNIVIFIEDDVEKTFSISLKGAYNAGEIDKALKLAYNIIDLDDESIISAVRLCEYDCAYRVGVEIYKSAKKRKPDNVTIENIRIMLK